MEKNEAKEIYTLGIVDFDDIEIGEIFAFNACWLILEKITGTKARIIAGDEMGNYEETWNNMKEEKNKETELVEEDIMFYIRGIEHNYEYNIDEFVFDGEYSDRKNECSGTDYKSCHKLPKQFQRMWKEE